MNDIYETWSLPWHVLQKALARGIHAYENAECEENRSIAYGTGHFRDVKARHATVSAGSWLSRAQGREASLPFR